MSQSLKFSTTEIVQQKRPIYRDPTTFRSEQVCPYCKQKTVEHHFLVDGYLIITHHCLEHRDVLPMRGVIVRDHFAELIS
jgi:hypothetical protein